MPPVILEWAASKSWFVYNMPDALWMYAFVSCLLLIWWQQRRIGMFYGLGALSAACMSELLQSYGWQAGTYDLLDIYYYVIATVAV